MEFYIDYEEQEYLLEIQELTRDRKRKFVFDNFGYDKYEISLSKVLEEGSSAVDITEMPKEFQDELGQILHQILGKRKTVVANPYFDEVMLFWGSTIFTTQEKLKKIDCSVCQRPNLYEKREKGNKTGFVESIKIKLTSNPNPAWPFQGNLLIQLSISDTQSRLREVDLDNLSKTVFDSLKGIVFDDDKQIRSFAADKLSVNDFVAYIVAIKRLAPNEKPKFQEFLFSTDQLEWDEEYQQKMALGQSTRFVTFDHRSAASSIQ